MRVATASFATTPDMLRAAADGIRGWRHYRALQRVCIVIAVCALVLVIPNVALAAEGVQESINKLGDSLFNPFRDALTHAVGGMIARVCEAANSGFEMINHSVMTGGDGKFTSLGEGSFSGFTGQGIAPLSGFGAFVIRITEAIKPLCYTVLGIVFAIRMIKVLQEPDNGPGNVPYVEKFGWLWVKLVLLKMIMDNSVDITVGLFNTFMSMVSMVGGVSVGEQVSISEESVVGVLALEIPTGTGGILLTIVSCLIVYLLTFALQGVVFLALYGRWMQIWTSLCFAPLFFSFAGLDETKSMFWSYLKTIAGLALAFVITAILLKSMGPVMTAFINSSDQALLGGFMDLVGIELVYCFSLIKAGSWARDLIGG